MEVGSLLRVIDGYKGSFVTLAALKLLPHVFVRPGELRHAEWGEFDLEDAVWTIPAIKTKMRREQRVPLSRQALTIIASIETDARRVRWSFLRFAQPSARCQRTRSTRLFVVSAMPRTK